MTFSVLLALRLPETRRTESGDQLYKELGAGKLDGVDSQSAPADEVQGPAMAPDGWMRLGPRRNRHRQIETVQIFPP